MIKIEIGKNDKGQRLDRFLKKYFDAAPLSMIYRLIRKDVKVNGRRGKEAMILEEGDVLTVYITEEQEREFHHARNGVGDARFRTGRGPGGGSYKKAVRQFKVVYEDEEMLVVSKPFGLLTHGDRKEKKNTLANQVAGYLQEKGDYDPAAEQTFRPSPVNRLDRNTTGLVIFGKTADATRRLAALIRNSRLKQDGGDPLREEGTGARGGVGKYYLTIVSGRLESEMVIDGALEKDEATNTVNVHLQESASHKGKSPEEQEGTGADAKRSVTIVRPVAWSDKHGSQGVYTLVEAELVTGRTHQIRAHLAAAGFPIIGDAKYGDRRTNKIVKEKFGLTTQLLHAARLEFKNKDGIMKITAPLPKRFEEIKTALFGTRNMHAN